MLVHVHRGPEIPSAQQVEMRSICMKISFNKNNGLAGEHRTKSVDVHFKGMRSICTTGQNHSANKNEKHTQKGRALLSDEKHLHKRRE